MTSQPPKYGQNIVRVSTADILAALGGSVVTSVTGTTNQITVTPVPGVGAVTVALANRIVLPNAPDATPNYGLVSLGSGPFDGVTAGFFNGNSNGTHIAVNTAAGYMGRMIDLQVAGVRMFAVGNQSFASAVGAVFRGVDIRPITVTVSGNTAITTAAGVNYVEIGQVTFSTAANITNASSLYLAAAPTISGGGAITNPYTIWSDAGANRFDAGVQFETDVFLVRDGANILALRNGTTAQTFRIYNTYANSGTDFESGGMFWNSSVLEVFTGKGGTGATRAIGFFIGVLGQVWTISTAGHLVGTTGQNLQVGAGVVGTSGTNVIAIGNGVVPSTSPADGVQLYSVDLSAGNATLGLRTETAVVTEVVVSDQTLSVVINGVTKKILLKS